ncbi:hypothetical protein CPB86DRAFT_592712 [Serendipita vermifera]|nr:hypothetical protein CPB86DRAFT_592712 [Serendipita vermifera]
MCVCTCVTNPLFLAIFLPSKQMKPPSGDIADVPGLYGPGTYWAWVLCTISALLSPSVKGHSSSVITPDQVVSLVYSTFSTYWYYIRAAWYGLEGPILLRDHSAQAAAFTLNIMTLFHTLGAIFSPEDKQAPWLILVVWDCWLLWGGPMMSMDLHSKMLQMIGIPIVFLYFFLVIEANPSSPWKVAPSSLLLFVSWKRSGRNILSPIHFVFHPKLHIPLLSWINWSLWSLPSLP